MRIRSGFKARISSRENLVVSMNMHFHSHLTQVLNQVVGEGVIIVDDE